MGLSSSQARLLSLTAKMHDAEYRAQRIEAKKLQLANKSANIYSDYERAIEKTKIEYTAVGTDGTEKLIDATYNGLKSAGYILSINNGASTKYIASTKEIEAYNSACGVKESFIEKITGKTVAPESYTEIFTADDLKKVQNNLSGKYILMADIDLSEENWAPLGTNEINFTGNFNGNGHTIKNLTINNSNQSYAGLFGVIGNGGNVTNIIIDNANITANKYAGILSGYVNGGNISNCQIINSTIEGTSVIGGAIGFANNSEITNCIVSNSTISATNKYAGGFIDSVKASNITNCSASSVTVNATNIYAAGFARLIYKTSTINNCSSSGIVNSGECSGGFTSYNQGTISNCNSSTVVNSDANFVGGFVSYNLGTISNSFATGDITGGREVGGFAGAQDSGAKINNCYSTGNVTEIINNSKDYKWNIGGFIGGNAGIINNSYSTGDVYGSNNVGGFVGFNKTGAEINNSYSINSVSTDEKGNNVGGFIGNNQTETTISNCYSNTNLNTSIGGGSYNQTIPISTKENIINNPTIGTSEDIGSKTDISIPNIEYQNTSNSGIEASQIFDKMTNGFISETDFLSEDNKDNADWLSNTVNAGFLILSKKNSNGEFVDINVATDTSLEEINDTTFLKKAEAIYEASLKKINDKDKKYDTELATIENERSAIKTEMETLKAVAKDNTERTFKLFG